MCYIELCQFARFVVTIILLTALKTTTDQYFVCFRPRDAVHLARVLLASYGRVSVCLSQVLSSVKRDERIQLVFAMESSFDQSCHVF